MEFESWQAETGRGPTAFVRERYPDQLKIIKFLANSAGCWREPGFRARLIQQVSNKRKRSLLRVGMPSRRPWKAMEDKLYEEIVGLRKRGRRVSGFYIRTRALMLCKSMYADKGDAFKASPGWLHRFTQVYKLKYRKKQKSKSGDPKEREARFMDWLYDLLKMLCTRREEDAYFDPKWGRFPPRRRINADQVGVPAWAKLENDRQTHMLRPPPQVPLPFMVADNRTWEPEKPDVPKALQRVHIRGTGNEAALSKRQATMHLVIIDDRPPEEQMKAALIFRGTGAARI